MATNLEGISRFKKYRRELGDLYVAAKIKQIANEDSLDLEEEKEHFMEWWKKNKVKDRDKNYDDVVEDEMMEQVSEKINTKSKKEPKKK